jgi:hypothetical protein
VEDEFRASGDVLMYAAFSTIQSDGEGPVLYQVRREDGAGLFATLGTVLTQLAVAGWLGLSPVVDLRKGNAYQESTPVRGTTNVWDYYFEPVADFTVADLDSGRYRVVKSETHHPVLREKANGAWYRQLWDRHVRLNSSTAATISMSMADSNVSARTIGVHGRGGDLRNFPGHPFPPTTRQLELGIQQLLESGEYDDIFVVSQESEIVDALRSRFGQRVSTSSSFKVFDRFSRLATPFSGGTAGSVDHYAGKIRPHHRHLLGLEVLTDVFLLARCGALVSGHSNVAHWSVILSGEGDKPWLKITNGWNSKNPFLAARLWAWKTRLPARLGGFSDAINLSSEPS